MKLITRLWDAEYSLREEGDGSLPSLIGHAAVFNQVYETKWFTEEIAAGAFKDSIAAGGDIAALWNHDSGMPLARVPDTLHLSEDEKGLLARIKPTNTSYGRDLVENIRHGVVRKMSFGFQIEKEEADTSGDKPHYRILKVKLWEVSPVTFPAYSQTDLQLADDEGRARSRLEAALRAKGDGSEKNLDRIMAELALRQREVELLKAFA